MRMGSFKRLAIVALVVCLFQPASEAWQAAPPANTTSQWSPIWNRELFPCVVISTASKRVIQTNPMQIGDPLGAFGVSIVSPQAETRVRVTIRVDGLSEDSSLETTLPLASQNYFVRPRMRFDVRKLVRVRELFPTTVVFSVTANGVDLGQQTREIQVRSVNDVPFAMNTAKGWVGLNGSFFAAFVDENHPWIDGILSEALKFGAIQQFTGYLSGSPQEVFQQAFAVWNVLQRHQVKYSNITQPSAQSQEYLSQHVRFLDESIQNSEANCVNGSVLFASILYKLGLYPALIQKPGHMFLGFYLDAKKQNVAFLETTLIGNPGLSAIQRNWKFLTRQGYQNSESYKQFVNALHVGDAEFSELKSKLTPLQPGYSVIDIDLMRRQGISAIPRL